MTAAEPQIQHVAAQGFDSRWQIRPMAGGRGSVVVIEGRRGSARFREIHRQRWWPIATVREAIMRAGMRLIGVHRLEGQGPVRPADRWVQIVARRH